MTLAAGTRLGPYEILSAVGAGGMGEVYKARDTRLDRTVAVKIVGALVGSRPELRQRFEREARVVSSLSHPHICPLFDIGEATLGDGPAGTGRSVQFFVMEFLEGETLAARLRKGALQIDQVLRNAVEIASALDAAHRRGIVHRDLKPGNIMLTRSGVKLLDFGLAKIESALVAPSASPPATRLEIPDALVPTVEAPLTAEHTVLGTLNYMAPEQLEGREADARSDLFAFGAVVYEMAAGRRAFDGPTPTAITAAILDRDPEPIAHVQPLTPPALEHLVTRCLQKDPDERWQTARDLLAELQWVRNSSGANVTGAHALGRTSTTSTASAASRARRRAALLILAGALALVAVLAAAMFRFGRTRDEPTVTRLDVVTPPTSDPFAFAISPDGRQLVFAVTDETGSKLWRRRLDETAAQPLPGTDGGTAPFWAPDNRAIGFFADGKLKRLDLDGRLPQVLANAPDARGGAWTRDDVIVFAPSTALPLFKVPAAGGTAVAMTQLDPAAHVSHRWPQPLPDGRVIFFVLGTAGVERSAVYVASLDGTRKRLADAETAAAFAPPGYLLLVDQGRLVARPVDFGSNTVGNPVEVAQPVASDSAIWRGAFSVSATGVLAHRSTTAARRQLVWVDRAGTRLSTLGSVEESNQSSPAISPDGTRVAVQRTGQIATHIWIVENGRDVNIRFRDESSPDGRPVWSPDGRRLAFLTALGGKQALMERAVGGSDERRLLAFDMGGTPVDWSADGRFLLYGATSANSGWDLWALPLEGDRKPFPVVQTPFNEQFGQLSRDSRWIAYQSNESGRSEIYVQPFPGPGVKSPISSGGGITPRWRRDGRELFYVAPDGALMAVPLRYSSGGSTLEPSAPQRLFRPAIAGGGSIIVGATQQYDVSADGQRFLINMSLSEATASPISVVLNWTAGLKK